MLSSLMAFAVLLLALVTWREFYTIMCLMPDLMPDPDYLSKAQIREIINAEWQGAKNIGQFYEDGKYRCMPIQEAKDIWNRSGLRDFEWREESFDCDDFSFAYRTTVSKHVCEMKLKYPYAVGVLDGSKPGQRSKHVVNVFLDEDCNVKILEPQSGTVVDGKEWDYTPHNMLM